MGSAEDIKNTVEWSQAALRLMMEHGVLPSPENYAVWFLYVSGTSPELNREIDAQLRQGRAPDASIMTGTGHNHTANTELTNLTLSTGTKLNSEVDQILRIIEETVSNSSALGTTVREASAGLSSQSTPSDIRLAVEAIVTASRKMEERSIELEEHLHTTRNELNELQKNLEKAHVEARTDALTGVCNRKAFDEALQEAIADADKKGASLCLVLGDIDHFKKFNDTYGHRTGDQVLKLVANSLKAGAADHHIVARYGGEEFAIIMPMTDLDTAHALMDKIRLAIQSRELVKRSTGESLGRVTMSFGISNLQPTDTPAALIERADALLYDAKRAGRNCIMTDASTGILAAKAG